MSDDATEIAVDPLCQKLVVRARYRALGKDEFFGQFARELPEVDDPWIERKRTHRFEVLTDTQGFHHHTGGRHETMKCIDPDSSLHTGNVTSCRLFVVGI